MLQVSVATLRRAVRAKKLVATRVGSRGQIRVSHEALDRYLARDAGQTSGSNEVGAPGRQSTSGDVHRAYGPIVIPRSAGTTCSESTLRTHNGKTPEGVAWRVIQGDVREAMESLDEKSVDCAVTSPPYYWQRDYEVEGQIGHEASIEAYVEALVAAFRPLRRALQDDGTFFLNLGDTYYSAKGKPHGKDDKHHGRQMMRRHLRAVDGPGLGLPRKSLIGIPWRVALALQTDGWTLRSAIIWERPAALPEPTAHDRPWRTYEHIFLFSKGPRYFFNREALGADEDVWRFVARPENPGSHFAPFPRELVERCMDVGCKPGGTVLDPFVGSGTTMLAALARMSPAIGIDLKREYCDFIVERIEREAENEVNHRSRHASAAR